MATSIPILRAAKPVRDAPKGVPLLRLAFRPFYLAGVLAAVLQMALWYFVFFGRFALDSEISPVLWHAHEMVYGFVAAVVVGFLFTAGKSWTELDAPRGLPLASLVGLWISGRMAGIFGSATVFLFWDVAFLPLVAAINLLFHLSAMGVLGFSPMKALHASVALVMVLIFVMAGRVIPMFTRNAIAGIEISTHPRREQFVLGFTALGLGLWVRFAPSVPTAVGLALAAVGHFWRLVAWSSLKTWRKPLVWMLHLSYAWMPVAFVLLALACLDVVPHSAAVHALTVGVMGGVVMGMMARTYEPGLVISGVCWVAAFSLYFFRYTTWLMTSRVDGKEG